jgi:hypothetical protein
MEMGSSMNLKRVIDLGLCDNPFEMFLLKRDRSTVLGLKITFLERFLDLFSSFI